MVHRHGFDPASIGTLAGASGGAKWLVLSQLDKAILEHLVPKFEQPVHLLGSSIGAWRFACYGQNDPIDAIRRFEKAYVEQTYSERPSRDEISATSRDILMALLGPNGTSQILRHPIFRTHVMAVRSRRTTTTEHKFWLGAALIAAAGVNLWSRRGLRWFFERALFFDERTPPPFMAVDDFPIQRIRLTPANLADSILASGSIPMVLNGVRDIDGGRSGLYRDGGLIDYHHDLQHSEAERLTFYPHFYDHLVPGWFDKSLMWRTPKAANISRIVLVSPSAEFVAGLPNGKIPDRQDFVSMTPAERVANWRACINACKELADEFSEALLKERIPELLKPLGNGR